jgi:VWFA-related protein
MARWRPRPFVAVLALVSAWCAAAFAEPTRPLVSLPLFVTDARGRSIENLKPADIEIAEAGTPQKVASIVFRSAAPRRVAFFLDEYHVSPGAAARVRASINSFAARHLRADDAVLLMKPLDSQSGIAPVSSLDALRAAVETFDGRRGVYDLRGPFEAEYMTVAPSTAERQRAQVVRSGIEALVNALHDGREAAKALILVTEGFRSSESSRMRTTTLRAVARAARVANVPVYILDPSVDATAESPLNDSWRAISAQTGGILFEAGSDLEAALTRVAADLSAHYVLEFQGAANDDGAFHDIDVKVKRPGVRVRAPSGYWAPFSASRFPPVTRARAYAKMLTPHASGLIQPWFRMAPGADGKTRVSFSWVPRPGRKVMPERVDFSALTFEGDTLHAAVVAPLGTDGASEAAFEVAPGPLQISMAIGSAQRGGDAAKAGATRLLDTDVRYIDVPRLDASRPFVSAVEFVRPRSLPEFKALQADPAVMPTDARAFHRQDRLLVRVRAFAASGPADVQVRLLNRIRQPLLDLPALQRIDGAAQFDLPFARFPGGDYLLEIRTSSGGETVTELRSIRIIG